MIAGLKYIYNDTGEIEAAIVPIQTWRGIEEQISERVSDVKEDFEPASFENVLVGYDLEAIIQEIREQ